MSVNKRMIDLDAARREQEQPDGFPVTLGGVDYLMPAELPVDVFDPFLSDDFDLAGLIRDAMAGAKDDQGVVKPFNVIMVDALFERPALPLETVKAIYASLALLFGADEFAQFKASRPSFTDYGRLVSGLFGVYGASMGEAFASPASSGSDGQTPNQTSPNTAGSTPGLPGDNPAPDTGSLG